MTAGPAAPGSSSSGLPSPSPADVGMVPSVRPLNPKVAALGGGHGLFAALSALRRVTRQLSAIVTVSDDGGSSGRLRRQYGVLPPGDLRMALAALCGDDAWGTTWSRVVQHRFTGEAELGGHAVGNVLIVALWELLGDTVQGLDWVGRLLGAYGRVLPMASVPLDLVAEVQGVDPERPLALSTVGAFSVYLNVPSESQFCSATAFWNEVFAPARATTDSACPRSES